jgi:hypothetical protein
LTHDQNQLSGLWILLVFNATYFLLLLRWRRIELPNIKIIDFSLGSAQAVNSGIIEGRKSFCNDVVPVECPQQMTPLYGINPLSYRAQRGTISAL